MTNKRIQFYATAYSREEAETKAKELLEQLPKKEGILYHYTTREEAYRVGETEENFFVSLVPTGELYRPSNSLQTFPSVVANHTKRIKEGRYELYLCLYDRLPFFIKHLEGMERILAILKPTPRPVEALPVEAINTPEGRKTLDATISRFEPYEEKSEASELLQSVEQELKIYTLYDNFNEYSLEEIKEGLETGDYDGGIGDGQLILSEATGETYKTEEEYLNALATICGEDAVEQHRERLSNGFRFYKALFFLQYIEYRLLQTEDYALVEAELPTLVERYVIKEEDLQAVGESMDTILRHALNRYLQIYLNFRQFYNGMTDSRVAEYLNAPLKLIQELGIKDNDIRLW